MSGFSFWYGRGLPQLNRDARGAWVAELEGRLYVAACDGDSIVSRTLDALPAAGDVIRLTFGASYVDCHRGDAFMCRLWLPTAPAPGTWFAGREARAVWP